MESFQVVKDFIHSEEKHHLTEANFHFSQYWAKSEHYHGALLRFKNVFQL